MSHIQQTRNFRKEEREKKYRHILRGLRWFTAHPMGNLEAAVVHAEDLLSFLIDHIDTKATTGKTGKHVPNEKYANCIEWDKLSAMQQSFIPNPCRWLANYECIRRAIRSTIQNISLPSLNTTLIEMRIAVHTWLLSIDHKDDDEETDYDEHGDDEDHDRDHFDFQSNENTDNRGSSNRKGKRIKPSDGSIEMDLGDGTVGKFIGEAGNEQRVPGRARKKLPEDRDLPRAPDEYIEKLIKYQEKKRAKLNKK